MPPEYLPGDDDEETPGEEGGDEKEAPAEGGDDAAKEEPKSEDQGKQDGSPTEEDTSEESEEGEEPSDTSAADIQAKLMSILEDRDDHIEEKISEGIKSREVAAKAEVEAEASAAEVNALFTRAKVSNEDDIDRKEALELLGQRAVDIQTQQAIEAPIIAKATQQAAKQFEGQYQEGMDVILEELDLADAAKALTDAEKAPLVQSKFTTRNDWTRAVIRAVKAKNKGGKAGTDKAKAERRKGTAARARDGSGTARLPRGRSDDAAEGKGQTARDYIMSGRDN